MYNELPRLIGGAYPAHLETVRVALPACTVHMKAIAEEDLHYDPCEHSFAKNTVSAEQQAPAFREGLITLLEFAPVTKEVIIGQTVKGIW